MVHFNWMDGLHLTGPLSFLWSLSFLFCFPSMHQTLLFRRLKHALSDSFYTEAGKGGTSPSQPELKILQRKTLLTPAGLHAHPWTNSSGQYSPNKQNRHGQLGNCEQGIRAASCPAEQNQNDFTTGSSDCKPNSLSFTSGLSLQGPYRVPLPLPAASALFGSRLGKDLRFLSCSCHLPSVFMGKLLNLWEPQLPSCVALPISASQGHQKDKGWQHTQDDFENEIRNYLKVYYLHSVCKSYRG